MWTECGGSHQSQRVAQQDEPWRRFGQFIRQVLHLAVDLFIFGADLVGLGVDDVYRIGRQLLDCPAARHWVDMMDIVTRDTKLGLKSKRRTERTYEGLRVLGPRGPQAELAKLFFGIGGEGI